MKIRNLLLVTTPKILIGSAALILCVLAYGGELGGTKWWVFNLAANLRIQLAVALGFLLVCATVLRCKPSAAICIAGLIPALFPVAYYWQYALTATTDDTVRILQVNVNCANTQYAKVVDYIVKQSPDIVLVEELTPDWQAELTRRLPQYPFRYAIARPDPTGIGEFSRLPMENLHQLTLSTDWYPGVQFQVRQGPRMLNVIHVHLPGPTNGHNFACQNAAMTSLARVAAVTERPLLIAGDFNATPWTRQFQAMLDAAAVQTTCTSKGLHSTWPSAILAHHWFGQKIALPSGPLSVAWRIPIDQFLISNSIVLSKLKVGSYVGSDHYPVTADFVVR
jgi:endonuclease/exonuclease/phosphatase (EEP) superfamily protein YafD